MHLYPEEIESFQRWMGICGADILAPINHIELMRVIIHDTTLIAWVQYDTGQQFWPTALQELHDLYTEGRIYPRLAQPEIPKKFKGGNRKARLLQLGRRDGWECWFCAARLQPPGRIVRFKGAVRPTIEELCPRQVGGPTHLHNQVLSCWPCNNAVGNLPVVDKIAFREGKRSELVAVDLTAGEASSPDSQSNQGEDVNNHAIDCAME